MKQVQTLQDRLLQAEQDLLAKENHAQRLLNAGKQDAALSLKNQLTTERKKVHRLRAQLAARDGGNLWEAAAQALTGSLVNIRWRPTESGAIADVSDESPPVITIDPTLGDISISAVLRAFLHECGHVVDYGERDSKKVTRESREARADQLAGIWSAYAEKNAGKYDQVGRNGLQIRLLALLDYSD